MKLGIFLLTENFHQNCKGAIEDDIKIAQYAENLEFDEVWFAEHHFNAFSVIPNTTLMMTYLAAKTEKIRIGSAAFLAPFYHPVRLAEEIATLDNLSSGRINIGFAKGGFALDIKSFNKSATTLREEMFSTVDTVNNTLYENLLLQPKPLQKKIPCFIATFSTLETVEYAAKNGYGIMFSQGATIDECVEVQEQYKKISGFYPETVLMRVFCVQKTKQEALNLAIPATEHFVKSMKAIQRDEKQPIFNKENYDELLNQRGEFFDGDKFIKAGIIGAVDDCVETIQIIKRRIKNLHLVLKIASTTLDVSKEMLQEFNQKIKPKL